jgi:putative peptide zinc metalloprotease protein
VLLFFLPASFLAVVLHEVGHALTVKHYGYEVPRAGVGWYWFGPMAFIDSSDMWLAPRGPRIAVNLAGVAANAVLAGIAALAAWVVPHGLLAAALWQFALSSYLMILFNLNPLLEFDGYFVLMDWLERPNLRPKALSWLGQELLPTLKARGLAGLRGHRLEVAYGVGSVLYIGVEAVLSVVLYRLFAEDWLTRIVPDALARNLAWALAALTVVLATAGVIADLRLARQSHST